MLMFRQNILVKRMINVTLRKHKDAPSPGKHFSRRYNSLTYGSKLEVPRVLKPLALHESRVRCGSFLRPRGTRARNLLTRTGKNRGSQGLPAVSGGFPQATASSVPGCERIRPYTQSAEAELRHPQIADEPSSVLRSSFVEGGEPSSLVAWFLCSHVYIGVFGILPLGC